MTYPHTTADCADFHQLVRDFNDDRPNIVTLCGSTRFYDAFQEANYNLTMKGQIVLSVGFYPHAKAEHGHGEGVGHDSAEKVALDKLHKRKIDLCDEVLVLNIGGYIGESTRSEIEYAEEIGRPVRYLEAAKCPSCESPEPRLHPAVQAEGEVAYICSDSFHQPSH
jgi:hypothetical protein